MKICYVFSLELPYQGDFNDYIQHISMLCILIRMALSFNEYTLHTINNIKHKIITNLPSYNNVFSYRTFSWGLKNEFEIAIVNEPPVFEPLMFYFLLLFLSSPYL